MAYAHLGRQRYREGTVKYHALLVLAFSTLLPVAAEAQFTTFTPPRPRVDSARNVPATPAQREAAADSMARVAITNMKAWVDSAAGDVVVNRADSTGRPVAATGPVTPGSTTAARRDAAGAESTTAFRDGAQAPDTATWLPLLVLVGTGAIGLGVVLLRWPRGA
ncbi:MAG: hypothetical protein ABR499_13800 [Gemmatimonadaceae bacterium]